MWNIKATAPKQAKQETLDQSPASMQDSSTSISSSKNPSVYGENVIFSIKVTRFGSLAGIPGGLIDIKEGKSVFASDVRINSLGESFFETKTLGAGNHSMLAIRRETTNFRSSISPAITQMVKKADTLTVVKSSSESISSGETTSFTATVKVVNPGSGIPAGVVDLMDASKILAVDIPVDDHGEAYFQGISLSKGDHFITAVYKGSDNYKISKSEYIMQRVVESKTNILNTLDFLVQVQNPVEATELAVDNNGNKNSETENIFITPEYNTEKSIRILDKMNLRFIDKAPDKISKEKIVYQGSTSETIKQTVSKANTLTTITSLNDSLIIGEKAAFTATVEVVPPGGGVPDGTIDFKDGGNILAAEIALDSRGQAAFENASISEGLHSITAEYSGSATYNNSISASKSYKVNKIMTRTTVSSSKVSTLFGERIMLAVIVTSDDPGQYTPNGTIDFRDGNSIIAADVELDSSGQAFYEIGSLSLGDHSIYAIYKENANFEGSIAPVVFLTVNKVSTLTTVTSSKSSVVFGEKVRFTARVTAANPEAGIPDGTVDFKDDNQTIALDAVLDSSGETVCDVDSLFTGDHYITAVYTGSPNYESSVSK